MSSPPTPQRSEKLVVGQRLMRGYGPLAVFALMILMISVLVPSKVPENGQKVASGGKGGEAAQQQYSDADVPDPLSSTPGGSGGEDCATEPAAKGKKPGDTAPAKCDTSSTDPSAPGAPGSP